MIGKIKKGFFNNNYGSKKSKKEHQSPVGSSSKDISEINISPSKSCNDIDINETSVGKYLILTTLGKSVATVYLAEKILKSGKRNRVVLKKQKLSSPRGHSYLSTARNECMILRELNSEIYKMKEGYKYIIKMVDEVYSIASDEHFLVLEHCELGSLIDILNKRDKPFPLTVNRRIIKDVMLGVEFMHSISIAHRDIKLENLLLQQKGGRVICKLADFGLSAIMYPGMVDRSVVGSPRNAAPDLIKYTFESREKNPFAVDVWAVGAVFYALLELAFPYNPDSPQTYSEDSRREKNADTGLMTPNESESLFTKIFLDMKRPRENFLDDICLSNFLSLFLSHDAAIRPTIKALLQHEFMQQQMEPLQIL